MALLSESPVWSLLESPLREEDSRHVAQRKISRLLLETTDGVGVKTAALQLRCIRHININPPQEYGLNLTIKRLLKLLFNDNVDGVNHTL